MMIPMDHANYFKKVLIVNDCDKTWSIGEIAAYSEFDDGSAIRYEVCDVKNNRWWSIPSEEAIVVDDPMWLAEELTAAHSIYAERADDDAWDTFRVTARLLC
jgi:hypothetical protein